ncbi:hypothetical protein H0R92_08780 [Treponema sp. OMZ 840]|uniref:hypothetical protein n=1 Tax=Treponema sp. OMZ 840 TaxID=244313 RepID=UPI003D938A0E
MINIDDVLRIKNNRLELNSGLSEQEFARSRLAQYMSEEGLLCKPLSGTSKKNAPCPADSQGGASFTIEAFRFTQTHVKDGAVVLSAPAFKGRPLLSFIQTAMSAPAENSSVAQKKAALEALDAAYCAVRMLSEDTEAQKTAQDKTAQKLHNCGPLSILYGEDGSVLFLPPSLFERSMLARSGKERAFLYGFWVRGGTSEKESFTFSFGSCLYAVLTGRVPFPAADDEARIADYTDDNFIPLSLLFPYIADNDEGRAFAALIQAIDSALVSPQAQRTSIQIKRQKSTAFPSMIVNEGAFTQNPLTPLQIPQHDDGRQQEGRQEPKAAQPAAHAAEDKALFSFINAQQKRIGKRRFMRKHGTKLAFTAAVVVIICAAAFSIVKANMQRPTTKGMTPLEVVHTFYTALHELDTIVLDGCGDKKAIKAYSNTAASLFVMGKVRQAYEKTPDFLPPEQWLFSYNPLETWIFGLTRLSVNALENTSFTDSVSAQKGDSVRLKAEFFMLANEGPEHYAVSRRSDELTLTFNKMWRITALKSSQKEIAADDEAFRRDIAEVLETAQKAPQEAFAENLIREIGHLYGRYPWLPDEAALRHGVEKIPEYCRFR